MPFPRQGLLAVLALIWVGLLVLVAVSTARRHGRTDHVLQHTIGRLEAEKPGSPKALLETSYKTPAVQLLGTCNSTPWTVEQLLRGHQLHGLCVPPMNAAHKGPYAPWTHRPVCTGTGDEEYCVYTDITFRGGRGLSVIVAPHVAAAIAVTLDDSGVPPRLRDHPSTNLAGDPAQEHGTAAEGNSFEIQRIPGRGKGVVATRRIKAGEVVLVDYPIIVSQNSFNTPASTPGSTPATIMELLQVAMKQLTPGQQARVHALAHSRGGERVRDILQTNAFGIEAGGESLIGLFPLASRINHNCQPNAHWRYSRGYQSQEVIALRDIEPGEEVSHSYTPLGMVYQERQYKMRRWDFDCACPLCSASHSHRASSDRRRRRLNGLYDKLRNIGRSSKAGHIHSDRSAVLEDTVNEILFLIDEEQIWPLLCDYYVAIAKAYLDIADYAKARQFWDSSYAAWIKFGGEQHDHFEELWALREQIRNAEESAKTV